MTLSGREELGRRDGEFRQDLGRVGKSSIDVVRSSPADDVIYAVEERGVFRTLDKGQVLKKGDWQHYTATGTVAYIIHHGHGDIGDSNEPNMFQKYTCVARCPERDE